LQGLANPLSWYADHPTHYAGDARTATAAKGRFLFQAWVEKVVRLMRAIKADRVTPELQREFYERGEDPLQTG
jgi:creatinine amidohydrolase